MTHPTPKSQIILASKRPQMTLRDYEVIGTLPPAQAAAINKLIESGELVRRLRRAARDFAEPTPGEQLHLQHQPPAKTRNTPVVQPLRISATDLCECLGISRRTLGDWMRKKTIPYEKIGGRVLFDVADVDRALRRFRIKAVGD